MAIDSGNQWNAGSKFLLEFNKLNYDKLCIFTMSTFILSLLGFEA